MKRTILLLACLSLATGPLAFAISCQVELVNRYIWRGFDQLPENHAAVQPSFDLELGKSGFSLNLWCSFALAQRGIFRYSDEIDLTLSYTRQLPKGWEMSLGLTHYGYWFASAFKYEDNTSLEVVVTAAKTDWLLSPQLSVYYDFNLGSGLYVTLGGSHEMKISGKVNAELGGLVGFNSRQYIDGTGFSDIGLFVKAPLALGKLTLTPSLNAMIPLLDEVNEEVEIWLGISAIL